jgi:FKBP12-rapamycin complex-associated protein
LQIVGDIIERLLTVGIADQDSTIRSIVLASLDDRFDEHLAQSDNVRAIFIALNDEVFSIRELSMELIGRLAVYRPPMLMPSIRKILLQLLTELEYSTSDLHKEEAARLLCILVSKAKHLIRPYIEPILKVLLPKTADAPAGVLAKILTAIGELSLVGGKDLVPYVEILMPLIIDTLSDGSNCVKREAALKVLGQLCQSTCSVVDPYLKYPNLLNLLIQILKTDTSVLIRRETVRVMGILGAVDPYQHKVCG